ncbi:MAG: hypothetical protein C4582_03380 [Desulfobacteraceae bacterium]|jgi:hypothetical protein|nr:MAG: hypothetical protein C4582_03380 [Desulfobacteraceae bacterium]
MDEQEFEKKYIDLKILKSIQEYLKSETDSSTAIYPIRVPEELLYQKLRSHGAEDADFVIHQIFKLGLTLWSEQLFSSTFGNEGSLREFIKLVKNRNKKP